MPSAAISVSETRHANAPAATDEVLVRLALEGERGAFEQLVRRHRHGLVRHLYRQIGQRDAARDLAQDVFLKVYLSLGRFDPRYRFTTWLYRIATNCAIDSLRRKTAPTCSLDDAGSDEDGVPRSQLLVGDAPGPHEMLRFSELQSVLARAIEELPAGYRELLELRNRRSFRYDEIARITDLPVGTVKNRIFRARALLREALGERLDFVAGSA